MTVVLVHGVPETPAVWDLLTPQLDPPFVALALPGFGNRRPEGFQSTMGEYIDWLEEEIRGVDEAVDLVGRDWGGILTTRLVTTRPGLVRSWVSDAVVTLEPDFVWHDFAKIWQTPQEGEKFWDDLRADPDAAATVLSSLGVPEKQARQFADTLDEEMTDSILKLYRSATDIPGDWGPGNTPAEPGLVIGGENDPFINAGRTRRMAERLDAQVSILESAGHWWPLDSADRAAEALQKFWAGLPD